MNKFYLTVDVGGTFIKFGAISEDGKILCSTKTETKFALKSKTLAETIAFNLKELCKQNDLNLNDSLGIGIGLPGLIDTKNGILIFSGNLKLENYKLLGELKKLISLPIKIENDANVASLAELKIGSGKGLKNFVMLVIGTGVGCSIIINGELLQSDFSGEIGHMKITQSKPLLCTCGEKGCFETVASTTALVRQTKLAMKKNPNSKMWSKYNLKTVCGKTPFEFEDDETAKAVLENYIKNLGDGIVNIVNILKPEAIIVGGAISNQREKLLVPLESYVNNHIFTKIAGFKVKIIPAKFTGDAGIIGAKYLFKEEK